MRDVGVDFERVCKSALLQASRRTSKRTCKRTFKIHAPVWLCFFWGRFSGPEKVREDKERFGICQARLMTQKRIHDLFGDSPFFRELESTASFLFIASKAYANQKWATEAVGAVSFEKSDCVAVL